MLAPFSQTLIYFRASYAIFSAMKRNKICLSVLHSRKQYIKLSVANAVRCNVKVLEYAMVG